MRSSWYLPWLLAACLGPGHTATAQPPRKDPAPGPGPGTPLVPPMLPRQAALEAGNPLATYAAMLELEPRYRGSKALAGVYAEVRFNFEEFLGFPMAGVRAMALPVYRTKPAADAAIPLLFAFVYQRRCAAQLRQRGRYAEWHELVPSPGL